MEFLNPLALFALTSLPIFYFFFLFRQRSLSKKFSSLLIWQKVEKKSPNFKSKARTWFDPLLLLQLLILLLLILALGEPVFFKTSLKPRKIGILFDLTASMQAPYEEKMSRWQKSLVEVKKLLDSLSPKDQVQYFTYPPSPSKKFQFISPKKCWLKIQKLSPTFLSGEPLEYFQFLKNRFSHIDGWFFFTDHLSKDTKGLVSVGSPLGNIGITNLAIRKIPDQKGMELLVKVGNFSSQTRQITLEIQEQYLQKKYIKPFQEILFFQKIPPSRSLLKVKIFPQDSFLMDNQGIVGLSYSSNISVYSKEISRSPLYYALKATGKFHFISFQDWSILEILFLGKKPLKRPVTFIFPRKNFSSKWFQKKRSKFTRIFSTPYLQKKLNLKTPLSFFVQSFFPIPKLPNFQPIFQSSDQSWGGAFGKIQEKEIWIFGFHMTKENTHWVYDPSFPYFWNSVGENISHRFAFQNRVYKLGESYKLALPTSKGKLTTPSGKFIFPKEKNLFFSPKEIGTYHLQDEIKSISLPVNFCSKKESNLFSSSQFFQKKDLPTIKKYRKKSVEWKNILLILAFCGILLVWWLREKKSV